jgi:hypothetical protein
VCEGALYALLGWRASKRSLIALGLGIALFAVDTLFAVVTSFQVGGAPPTGPLVARFLFFLVLIKGVKAARELRAGQALPARAAT